MVTQNLIQPIHHQRDEVVNRVQRNILDTVNPVLKRLNVAWLPLSITKSWAAIASPAAFATTAYFVDVGGVVHLKVSVQVASGVTISGDTIATLPAGARPSQELRFTAYNFTGAVQQFGAIEILPSGVIKPQAFSQTGAGVGNLINCGISFLAEQ